ncbi:MAG TPA: hypothetical protein VLX92_25470 [Kofleriaceae bacterium]|nr:hypothetical protein [Kofleriaceae bacterium]
MSRLRVLAALAAWSCGGAQRAAGPPAAEVKTYAPLAAGADARLPARAVILATDARGGSTVIPLAPGRVQIDGAVLAVAPNPAGAIAVTGGADAWSAAIAAATVLDKDVADYTFSASGSGGSALYAAGFLAALTGAPIDGRATVLGTIAPGGAIGPDDGLADKLTAAIARGKTRIGVPAGADGDLVALARAHGGEAIELADVRDAYRVLTGATLPAPVPLPAAELAIDPATAHALDEQYTAWRGRIAAEWATIVQLEAAGRLPALLATLRAYSVQYAGEAEKLHKQGAAAAAYSRILVAWAYAASTTATYDVLSKLMAGDAAGAKSALAGDDQLERNTAAVFDKIGAFVPTTVSGHLAMLSGFKAALEAWVYEQYASAAVAQTAGFLDRTASLSAAEIEAPATADRVVGQVAPTMVYVRRTVAETALALEELELEPADHTPFRCATDRVARTTAALHGAVADQLGAVDARIVQPIADRDKLPLDDARRRFAMAEPDFLVAVAAASLDRDGTLPHRLRDTWGEHSLPATLLALAGSELAYHDIADLMARYAVLGIHPDLQGKVQSIDRQAAFSRMLETADRDARAAAHQARVAIGVIPLQAKLSYQLATIERQGTLDEQVDALVELWASIAASHTAVMLGRD